MFGRSAGNDIQVVQNKRAVLDEHGAHQFNGELTFSVAPKCSLWATHLQPPDPSLFAMFGSSTPPPFQPSCSAVAVRRAPVLRRGVTRAAAPFGRIHIDLSVPFQPALDGLVHLIVFVDSASRW